MREFVVAIKVLSRSIHSATQVPNSSALKMNFHNQGHFVYIALQVLWYVHKRNNTKQGERNVFLRALLHHVTLSDSKKTELKGEDGREAGGSKRKESKHTHPMEKRSASQPRICRLEQNIPPNSRLSVTSDGSRGTPDFSKFCCTTSSYFGAP